MSKVNFEKLVYKQPSLITGAELFTGIHFGEIIIDDPGTDPHQPGDNSTGTGGDGDNGNTGGGGN